MPHSAPKLKCTPTSTLRSRIDSGRVVCYIECRALDARQRSLVSLHLNASMHPCSIFFKLLQG
jgi:hypothetical protein